MYLLWNAVINFLMFCFVANIASVEIVTLETVNAGQKAHREVFTEAEHRTHHIIDNIKKYNKRVKDEMRRKQIENFVESYKKKMNDNKAMNHKVEIIDEVIEDSTSVEKGPCKPGTCHHRAICISIGK